MEKEETVELTEPDTLSVENIHRVPKKAWKKWDLAQRALFNHMYLVMDNQTCLKHPDAPTVPASQWKTIRWNAAWLAADSLDADGMRDLLDW